MDERVKLILGDITQQKVDAIVNAANRSLLGGGGVDGAIHKAAGPKLLEECRKLDGCSVSQAKVTSGYNLPAKYVIHTVGPVWKGGMDNEAAKLAACYRNVLELAKRQGMTSIAFPSISTGAYRFPVDKAAKIALNEISKFLTKDRDIEAISIVCFDQRTYDMYKRLM